MLLQSCSNTRSTLPVEAYTCAAWPTVPAGSYGDVTLGKYAIEGNASYNDCKSKLLAMKP